ncbi:MAG: Abi family protein [Dysgonamonadaceae bacterium]|jgi:abortive infection bacteriophage resistance protein|nr:Abi family protein [Dysgonamonadaceae bacterium]
MPVNQDSRTIAEQIALLKSRGMLLKDEQKAAFYLNHISYFRLKSYWRDMQPDCTNHIFAPNSCFEDVIARYNFDRQLRLILFDAIEFIEIALRTKLIYHLSQSYGGLWYLNDNLVIDNEKYAELLADLQNEFARSGEDFAKDFRRKHPTDTPDVWLILEVATFGTLSKIYNNLQHQLPAKSAIANEFGLNSVNDLISWLAAISYMRNVIAHHSRIFGRDILKRPIMPRSPRNQWLQYKVTPVQEKKPFVVISTMVYLCNAINPDNEIKNKLLALFAAYPEIPIYKMGFFNNWQHEPLWK